MKTIFFRLIAFCLILLTVFSSCQKEGRCDVVNPKKNLPWLKEVIDGVEANAAAGFSRKVRIYQCTYRDGTGFLLYLCYECPDAGYSFVNCEGTVICGGGGFSGGDNCSEFNIRHKRLIYKLNP